ncbi:hypothetical protein GP486_005527 [Trichoglossum hirsutum]|uniref:CDC20/Fizzy WD40 domain-containing protein n=1 Tax=Trichoglossum hirsutum TaxID=265104 RepID=A0A9P8L931_9PEZI|nr:hypothetical protein GP486_005527 [Trichoglossum hirsutum]
MSKPVHRLSSSEKLLRRRSASPDPFSPTPHGRNGTGIASSITNRGHSRAQTGATGVTGVLGLRRDGGNATRRQASVGAFWNAGAAAAAAIGPIAGVQDGRGRLLGSGTNAPMYNSRFLEGDTPDQDLEKHEGRLALAFDVDQAEKVLGFAGSSDEGSGNGSWLGKRSRSCSAIVRGAGCSHDTRTIWRDSKWMKEGAGAFLDAPELRDDYYCNLLAYSQTTHSLAVGLNKRVYIWSELHGVQPMGQWTNSMAYLTALSFSSTEGGQAILAIGRIDGQITLWSLFDVQPRFEAQQPAPIACLAWKPRVTPRETQRDTENIETVATEELLVGDEIGGVYYYAIEWPAAYRMGLDTWPGSMILLARITVHTQQICGLAWSPDGEYFATGGNDNACCLFEAKNMIQRPGMRTEQDDGIAEEPIIGVNGVRSGFIIQPGNGRTRFIGAGRERHRWAHGAAVKAIAFCPWQRGLIATGGGSNDRCIHFFHTFSGACLATINVAAQVTSLIWSTTRREIAATFGYASPDHPYRIAVFSWPECRQVVSIPWASEMRALYAIAYPGGPNETNTRKSGSCSRTAEEGCIVVASSDESVKFHEVWGEAKGAVGGNKGMLGGSDILESLEGIDKEASETIR